MKKNSLLFLLIAVLILSGCSSLIPGNQGVQPVALTATFDAMVNAALQAAIAELTQEALLNPSATNTLTPVPPTATYTQTASVTSTFTPIPPTSTPLPPTATSSPTVTATRSDFNCQVVSFSPPIDRVYPSGGDFDGRWTFKNTGSEVWNKDNVDFVYLSGTKFQEHVDSVDLSTSISNGEEVQLIVDMLAPKSSGTYTATWGLKKDNLVFCTSTLQIIVK